MILIIIAAGLGALVFLKWRNSQTGAPPPAPAIPPVQPFFVPSPPAAPVAPQPNVEIDLLSIGAAYQSQREAEEKREALKGFLDAVVGFAKQGTGPTGPKAPTG